MTIHQYGAGVAHLSKRDVMKYGGRIPVKNVKIAVAVMFGLAAAGVILRTVKRILLFHKLKLDDLFVWFAIFCLGAGTACLYKALFILVLEDTIPMHPDLAVPVPVTAIKAALASKWLIHVMYTMIWTSTFAVKASFLALFWNLVHGMSKRLKIYYWFVVGFTVLTWILTISALFMACPNPSKCPKTEYPKSMGLAIKDTAILITISGTVDICGDIMIASIPICILRTSRMKIKQKLSLGMFLCLSFVMVIITAARIGGMKKGPASDTVWIAFWQHCEACVACVMASATPFRTIFITLTSRRSIRKRDNEKPSPKYLFFPKFTRKRSGDTVWSELHSDNSLPRPPRAMLSGLRTFIKRNHRDVGLSTVIVTTTFDMESTCSDPEREYQEYLRSASGIPRSWSTNQTEKRTAVDV